MQKLVLNLKPRLKQKPGRKKEVLESLPRKSQLLRKNLLQLLEEELMQEVGMLEAEMLVVGMAKEVSNPISPLLTSLGTLEPVEDSDQKWVQAFRLVLLICLVKLLESISHLRSRISIGCKPLKSLLKKHSK